MQDTTAATKTVDAAVREGLQWRMIGPHRGGRVVTVAGTPTDPMTYYFGACAGGVWKTTDGGTYWENVSDGFFKVSAVGAIRVAESDPNVIYVGTGEHTIRGNVSHGDGVYKSTDGGKTWANVGLAETRHIARIHIHPTDPDTVYVAALGHAFGPNKERGVYKSTDGGKSWRQVLFRSENAGAIDLSMDPHNPRILYAAIWEGRRGPHFLTSGGAESGLWKSTDGGETWVELTHNPGLPKGVVGKIGVAVSPAQADRVWALVEAEDGAVFRSDDGGESWQRLSAQGGLRWRAWYYMHIFADPKSAETVYVLNGGAYKSTDGGAHFDQFPTPHGDNHDLWIDPTNPMRMIEGNDGGATISYNGGASWSTIYNQPTAQFYHVITNDAAPYRVYGSQQDNTAIAVESFSPNGAITDADWYEPGGGESGYIAISPKNSNVVFGGAIGSGAGNGRLTRHDRRTGQERNITVWPDVNGMGNGAKELKYRFQWTFPLFFSRHNPEELYAASNILHRTTDEGLSWEDVSPDLTRNDPTTMEASGGPITKDNTGAEVYGTIFAVAESPHEAGVLWAGSDDGLVHLTRDGGKNWQNVTPKDLPEWSLISIIEASPHDAGTAYVAATRYKADDYRPLLFKTTDYGTTWTQINSGLPADAITRVVRSDPNRKGVLYCGTETGVFVSFDDGGVWHAFQGNLPVVPVHDLYIKGTDLIAATHGRSFWILDDLTPLYQAVDGAGAGGLRLFTPRETPRIRVYKGFGSEPGPAMSYRMAGPLVITFKKRTKPNGQTEETLVNVGENPPDGVLCYYYLPEKPTVPVTLTFKDASGAEIRTFTSKAEPPTPKGSDAEAQGAEGDEGQSTEEGTGPWLPAEAGLNRFVWDMRYTDATKIKGDTGTESSLAGPLVVPGTYSATLTAGDGNQTVQFAIVPDPRVEVSAADLAAQRDLLLQIRDKLTETHEGILALRAIRDQADAWEKRLKDDPDSAEAVAAAKALREKAKGVLATLIEEKADDPRQLPIALNAKLAALSGFVGSADNAPPKQTREVFADLSKRIDAQLRLMDDLMESDLNAFNRHIRERGTPAIIAKAARPTA